MKRLDKFPKFKSSDNYTKSKRTLIPEVLREGEVKFFTNISDVFDYYNVKSEMTLSFHHHLRNGDYVLNLGNLSNLFITIYIS